MFYLCNAQFLALTEFLIDFMASAFTRADPDGVRFAYREHGATQDGFGIYLKPSISLLAVVLPIQAARFFNMANPKLSSPRETCLGKSGERSAGSSSPSSSSIQDEDGYEKLVKIEFGKDVPKGGRYRTADRDLEKGKEEKMLREVGGSSPIYEVWREFGSLRMGWVVLREIWRGRWET